MLDIKLIRENPGVVRENLKRRHDAEKLKMLEDLIKSDKKWRELVAEINKLRARRNEVSLEIAKTKKEKKPTTKLMKEAADIPEKIKKLETESVKYEEKNRELLLKIPNLLHENVPYGKDDSENVEVKKWGKQPKFSFEPKSHVEILQDLELIDFERAAKVVGAGFYYMKGDLVKLDMALQRFALEHLEKKGFTFVHPPLMIGRKAYEGVTDLSDFELLTYKIEGTDDYLIATSEHPMAAMFKDEVINKNDLPVALAGISSCFRKEIGTHGKYTKGLFRVHQFNKVEQFVFCHPDQSWMWHEKLQQNSEELYQKLGLHYRVVNICTGDIGTLAAKKYDIEVWMADGKFREAGSNSNVTDYQARRLNVKWKEGPGKPSAGFVHTLNNTALATSRTIIAIVEQFQQADGSVAIPKVLQQFMNGMEKLEKKQ
ncbi:MAG TPA: serine--tRNA ligase [archaeon]|nr:serine--tRNA ligase [archaeon]